MKIPLAIRSCSYYRATWASSSSPNLLSPIFSKFHFVSRPFSRFHEPVPAAFSPRLNLFTVERRLWCLSVGGARNRVHVRRMEGKKSSPTFDRDPLLDNFPLPPLYVCLSPIFDPCNVSRTYRRRGICVSRFVVKAVLVERRVDSMQGTYEFGRVWPGFTIRDTWSVLSVWEAVGWDKKCSCVKKSRVCEEKDYSIFWSVFRRKNIFWNFW